MSSSSGGRSPVLGRGRAGRGIHAAARPAPIGRGRGRTAPHTGSQHLSPGSPDSAVPLSGGSPARVPGPNGDREEDVSDQPLCVKVHISSLAPNTDVNDVKTYFTTVCGFTCARDIEVSSAILLGRGKAELVLNGLLISELQDLSKKPHKIKGAPVEVVFEQLDKGAPPDRAEEEDEGGPITIVVGNVPRTESTDTLKTFFEAESSGGCEGAVSEISSVRPGLFHVSFHDQSVADQVMSRPRKIRKSVFQMSVLNEGEGEGKMEEEGEGEEGEWYSASETEENDSDCKLNQIEVGNVPRNVSEKVLKRYFETAKANSCDKAVSECVKLREGCFIVTFHDPEVAANVMSKSEHKYKETCLSVCWTPTEKEGSPELNQIEVGNVPMNVSEKVLKRYFETAKANSQEKAVSECTKVREGVFTVTFHDPEVAANVMSKSRHMYKDICLSLEYVRGPLKTDQLLVRGLPPGLEKDEYEIIFSDMLGMEEIEIVINDDSSATLNFASPYSFRELQIMMKKIAEKGVDGTEVTVEMVKDAKPSIHVYNMTSSHCDEEFLKLYFSRPDMSDGGEVESVTIPSKTEAIITFVDPKVIQPVLQKDHAKFLGPDTVLEVHGGSSRLTSDSGSTPEPLEFTLDPLLLESISLNPRFLEQSVSKHSVMFTADPEKGLLVLSPTGRPNPKWRQECESLVPQYLTQMTKESVHVPREAATEARDLLQSMSKDNPSLRFSFSGDGTQVAIAGETSTVTSAIASLNSLSSDLATYCTESVLLSPKDFDYLEQVKVKQTDFPSNIECYFDIKIFTLILKGPKGIVMKLKNSMQKIASHSETSAFLDPLIIEFFKTETGRGKLGEFLQDRKCHTAVHFSEVSSHMIYFLSDPNNHEMTNKIRAITEQLPSFITNQTIPVPEAIAPVLTDMNEFTQLCQTNEKKYKVLIKQTGHEVSVAGFKSLVVSCVSDFRVFFKGKSAPPPPLEIEVSSLVATSIERSPQALQRCLHSFTGELHYDTARGIIRFAPAHHLNPGWDVECRSIMSDFIKANVIERSIMIPEKAGTEIFPILQSSQQHDRTFVSLQTSPTSLSFSGSPNIVKLTEQSIVQVCSRHAYTNVEIPLEPNVFELVRQVKLQSIKRKFQSVTIKLVTERNSLTLSGPAKEVKEAEEYVPNITTRMISVHVNVRKPIFMFLSSEKGKEQLLSFVRGRRGEKCAVYVAPSSSSLALLCTVKHKSTADKICKAILDYTTVNTFKIPDLLQPFFPELPEFTTIVEHFQGDSATIAIEGSNIAVTGFRDEVLRAVDMLTAMVKEKVLHFTPVSVEIDPIIAKCVQQNQEDLQFWASSMHVTCKLNVKRGKATVTVSPTTDTQPDWRDGCRQLLLSYLDGEYFKATITFPKEAAEDASDVLVSTKDIIFEMGADGNNATLAGERNAVEGVKQQLHDMCAQKRISQKIKLSDREYDYFTQVVKKTFKSVTAIESSAEKYSLTVAGSLYDVSETVKSITEAVKHAVVPVSVDAVVVRFIDTEGRGELQNKMREVSIRAAIHVKMSVMPPSLELLCQEQLLQHVQFFTANLPGLVTTNNLVLSDAFNKPPFSTELRKYSEELTTKHHVLIETRRDGVQICGFKKAASDVQMSLEKFIQKKSTVSRMFNIQMGMWRLLTGPMKDKWNKIDSACRSSEVEFTVPSIATGGGGYVMEFKGDEIKVKKIMEDMTGVLQSTHKTTVALKSAQICQYFLEKGEGALQIPGIEKQANVVIEVCRIRSSEPATMPMSYVSHASKTSEQCSAQVVDRKHIVIHLGDITQFQVDVIVNAANEELKHIGGLAYTILRKGGKEIQDASDRYTKSHGKLGAGDVWLSTVVGKLPCQALIHAVGPRWQRKPTDRDHLKEVCIKCLTSAIDYTSIALPAISTGTFGCPMDICADVMISSTVEFCNTHRSAPLEEINIVLFKDSDVPHFVQALGTHLPPQSIKSLMSSHAMSGNSSQPLQPAYVEEEEEPTKAGPSPLSRVCIKDGGVLDVKGADVYVNSTNAKMDLSGGAIAQALSKAAGPDLQTECTKKAPIAPGEIAVTGAGNMQCKCIIHVNCPGYDKSGQAEEMLRTIMSKCMSECETRKASTIVFPAIGTGNLRFPVATSAHVMVDELCNYLQQHKCESLSNVYIMIYKDSAMLRAFSDELEKRKQSELVPMKKKRRWLSRGRRTVPPAITAAPTESKPVGGAMKLTSSHSLDFGNGVTMEILKGDITQESTDAIVNTTNEGMVLDSGVSLALGRKAGTDLQEACNALNPADKQGLRDGKVIETKSGNLQCKHVFHVMFRKDTFVKVVTACIEKARELKHKSISFPAIGTGQERYPADAAARDMITGMKQCKTGSQVHVRIVLFQEEVYSKFVQVLASPLPLSASPLPLFPPVVGSACSVKALPPTYETTEVGPSTVNHEIVIFGETQQRVSTAEKSLRDFISKQFKTDKIVDTKIGLLRDTQVKTFKSEASNMQLIFCIDRKSNTIELEGSINSVCEMKMKVKDALSKVEKAETLVKTVQWKRQDSTTGTSYDPLLNLEIEENSKKSSHTVKDDVSGEHFTIDFTKMQETDHTLRGKTRKIIRVTVDNTLPEDWEPMTDPATKKEVPLRVIDLAPGSRGYTSALAEFDKTMKAKYKTIVSIQRVQNPVLHRQYIAKKKHLDSQNPSSVQNERWLFHGTKPSSITLINQTNFNRSYRGQNGTAYGQGCYFARDASYSNAYASPDDLSQKYMYVVRVLTGQFTTGNSAMIVAPPKDPSDKAVLFDSVVNSTTNPTIFVIFYDADAYPEYLITYK